MPVKTRSVKSAGAKTPAVKPVRRRTTSCKAIIAAAARLFAKLGYAECDMDRLAAKLGVAKGTLYLYFESKEALFCACVDDGMSRSQEAVTKAAETETDLLKKVEVAIRAYLAFFDRHPHYIELLLQERAIFKSRRPLSYFKNRDVSRQRWRDVYAALIKQRRFRQDLPVDRLLDVIGNLLYGTIFSNYFVGKSVSAEQQFQSIWKVLMHGLAMRVRGS